MATGDPGTDPTIAADAPAATGTVEEPPTVLAGRSEILGLIGTGAWAACTARAIASSPRWSR